MNGVVLAVDREDRDAVRARRLGHERAGHHQHFLVRQRNGLAGSIAASTASSASVPDEAHMTRSTSGCVATATSPSGRRPRRRTAEAACERSIAASVGHRDHRGGSARSARQPIGVLARGEPDHLQTIGMRATRRQRALADRSGRAENRDRLFVFSPSPKSFTPSLCRRTHEHVEHRRCKQQRVDPIEHAAVSGDHCRASFMPALRFSIDSNRSPTMPSATIATPRSAAQRESHCGSHQWPTIARRERHRTRNRRPRLRSVFFGLIAGASGRRPNTRPK